MPAPARRLALLVAATLAIAVAGSSGCTPDTLVLTQVDTVIVQRPGRTDTIVVTRPDTVILTHAETSYVQLPGRVDTIVRVDTLVQPPRVDTLVVPRVDTVVVVRPETTVVVRPETLVVVRHDTVIVHDTITHYDTVRIDRTPAYLCIYMTMGDTLAALNWDEAPNGYCDAAHLAANAVPGTWNTLLNVDTLVMKLPAIQAALTRLANRPPSPLILPGYWTSHR